jgi:hypothetical protein
MQNNLFYEMSIAINCKKKHCFAKEKLLNVVIAILD